MKSFWTVIKKIHPERYNAPPTIKPTPVIGMVGIMDNPEVRMTKGFKYKGDMIFLIGKSYNDISSSEYLFRISES